MATAKLTTQRLLISIVGLSILSTITTAKEPGTEDAGDAYSSPAIPTFREKNDCGRIAAYLFANLSRPVEFSRFVGNLPVGNEGIALAEINRALHAEGFRTRIRFLSPAGFSEVSYPAIVQSRYAYDQYHFTVIIDYDPEKDVFTYYDIDRAIIFTNNGRAIRKRLTGYLIECPRSDWNVWLLVIALLFVATALSVIKWPAIIKWTKGAS